MLLQGHWQFNPRLCKTTPKLRLFLPLFALNMDQRTKSLSSPTTSSSMDETESRKRRRSSSSDDRRQHVGKWFQVIRGIKRICQTFHTNIEQHSSFQIVINLYKMIEIIVKRSNYFAQVRETWSEWSIAFSAIQVQCNIMFCWW